ncbi:hypothetical protein CCAX7_11660 [Capsulimonas corticalis]|uniref:Uncharacterized protein n=1 Tax=Capsulimonas corticalis TaxID=2219043 RepID=A0A402CUX0_9BACT|nr:DUF642 domain-containing protein [Capsulimonas corticalis]BDI29115.1 hypothetical protein CCAX7_11660 [Capsulimonas corticalis]
MFKNIAIAAFAVTAAFSGMTTAHAENLITNGSFEAPSINPGSYSLYNSIPGWTLASGSKIEIQNNIVGKAADGFQFVELDSDASSSIMQTINTTAGKHYQLTFAFSARPGTGLSDNILGVNWNGASVSKLTANGSGQGDTHWKTYTYDLVAHGSTSTVQFSDLGASNSLGTYIDHVSVAAVPEPSTVASFLIGGVALAALGLRRRKSVMA